MSARRVASGKSRVRPAGMSPVAVCAMARHGFRRQILFGYGVATALTARSSPGVWSTCCGLARPATRFCARTTAASWRPRTCATRSSVRRRPRCSCWSRRTPRCRMAPDAQRFLLNLAEARDITLSGEKEVLGQIDRDDREHAALHGVRPVAADRHLRCSANTIARTAAARFHHPPGVREVAGLEPDGDGFGQRAGAPGRVDRGLVDAGRRVRGHRRRRGLQPSAVGPNDPPGPATRWKRRNRWRGATTASRLHAGRTTNSQASRITSTPWWRSCGSSTNCGLANSSPKNGSHPGDDRRRHHRRGRSAETRRGSIRRLNCRWAWPRSPRGWRGCAVQSRATSSCAISSRLSNREAATSSARQDRFLTVCHGEKEQFFEHLIAPVLAAAADKLLGVVADSSQCDSAAGVGSPEKRI